MREFLKYRDTRIFECFSPEDLIEIVYPIGLDDISPKIVKKRKLILKMIKDREPKEDIMNEIIPSKYCSKGDTTLLWLRRSIEEKLQSYIK